MPTRRQFCATAAVLAFAPRLRAQATSAAQVAAIEHDHVLAEADAALKLTPRTITTLPSPNPVKDATIFYSEPDTAAHPFRDHAEALLDFSAAVSALTAAFVITKDDRYALAAGRHLFAWCVNAETRMAPAFDNAFYTPATAVAPAGGVPAGVIDAVPLAEVARALPFLADTAALSPPDLAATRTWFKDLLTWLTTAHVPVVARDTKDHTASAWLLTVSAIARLLADEATLTDCRNRFKRPTLRNQINANGIFIHEISSPNPLRATLLNFDLLATTCDLLSTQFFSLWDFELEDGPGMRALAAYLYPLLKDPARWPYPADAAHFREVPRRRPGLLFAGRAYNRPEYVDLWKSLPAPAPTGPLRAAFPIRQAVLFTTRAPHGA